MNFNKLPKEKQTQLIAVVLFTLMIACGLWFGLIKLQYDKLDRLAKERITADDKLHQAKDTVKNAARLEADLAAATETLSAAEADVASGDLYFWIINTIGRFKGAYPIDIPQFGQIDGVHNVPLFPAFQYQQTTITVAGTGHFFDIGRFLADFENEFPHIRVSNLSLELNGAPNTQDPETLSFRMDVVTLVKPNAS